MVNFDYATGSNGIGRWYIVKKITKIMAYCSSAFFVRFACAFVVGIVAVFTSHPVVFIFFMQVINYLMA